jgi:PAS domain S-box-containing protein
MASTERPSESENAPSAADQLRQHAEELLHGLAEGRAGIHDAAALVHELRVHQIELEMQNDELRRTHLELDEERAKYVELFDLAPVGYLTLTEGGIVVDANLTAAHLLGVERQLLVGHQFSAFVFDSDRDAYHLHEKALEKTTDPQSCELRLYRVSPTSGTPGGVGDFWARLELRRRRGPNGETVLSWVTFADITACKQAERDAVEGNSRLAAMSTDVIAAMGRVVETRDPYTQGHEQRVAVLGKLLAEEMGLTDDDVAGVEVAGLLHDTGKAGVPVEILTKPGRLSTIEFRLIMEHPLYGYEILKDIAFPWPIADSALQHHERMDGSGYPEGLKGEDICLTARILAVADVVEAMSSDRPYRAALGVDAAVAEIASHPHLYDSDVVSALLRLHESGRIVW